MSGETEDNRPSWTPDLLFLHLQTQLDDLKALLQERYENQQGAMEKAFAAAEKAVEGRAAELDKEFHEHLIQYRHEVTLAFEASDKAITKSEVAMEKRFDSVNEFRGQLSDQAARFVLREVADAQATEFRNQIAALTGRLDTTAGGQVAAQRLIAVGLTAATVIIAVIVFLANYVFAG